MSLNVPTPPALLRRRLPRPPAGSARTPGDLIMLGVSLAAGVICLIVLVLIFYKVFSGAGISFDHYGLGFIGQQVWAPNFDRYGAATELYGTVVTSAIALLVATPLAIGIAVYLALLAPPRVRAVIGPLVEMLAAIPSVIVGLWGLIVVAPFLQKHLENVLHAVFGFIPIFGEPQAYGTSVFTAGLVLAIMVLPIVASISRDLFLTVPQDLQDGAAALGATRWEVIRGVIIPSTISGLAAAVVLGLGRALGEAIAVTQVIGAGSQIHANLFLTGQSLSSQIATDYTAALDKLGVSSLFYLAVILLIFTLSANLLATYISSRFGRALSA